jgi:hypothetical protein
VANRLLDPRAPDMNYCTITWDPDTLAAVHATNRDAVVVITVLKSLTDMASKRSGEDVPGVALTRARMSAFGITARRIHQALESLEQLGLATLRRKPGQAYRVRLDPCFYHQIKARRKGGWIDA